MVGGLLASALQSSATVRSQEDFDGLGVGAGLTTAGWVEKGGRKRFAAACEAFRNVFAKA